MFAAFFSSPREREREREEEEEEERRLSHLSLLFFSKKKLLKKNKSRSWNDTAVREALLSSRSPVSKPAPTASKASPEAKAAMCEVLAGRLALVGLLFLVVVERQTGGAGALEQLGLLPSSSVAGGAGGVGDARALLLWLAFAGLAWATRFRSGGAGKRRR